MQRIKTAVISNSDSDILKILSNDHRLDVTLIPVSDSDEHDLAVFDVFFLLGGTEEDGVLLPCGARNQIEDQMRAGKKVFAEFFYSIGDQYFLVPPKSTRFSRMIYNGKKGEIEGLEPGDLLEDQCNTRLEGFYNTPRKNLLLFTHEHIPAHRHIELSPEDATDVSEHTLWIENDSLMICTFRMCNFIRACFAPKAAWRALVEYILKWATGLDISSESVKDHYTQKPLRKDESFETQAMRALNKTKAWFERAGMLIREGKSGMYEGFATEIYPDGSRKKSMAIRDDCIGEVSMMFGMDALLAEDTHSMEISNNLMDFMFRSMQCKNGPLRGMLRWSDMAWGVCYTHDTGRAVFGELMKAFYMGHNDHLQDALDALDFLIKTSGTNALRARRTDALQLTQERLEQIAQTPGDFSEAPESYSLGAMLLAYQITGITKYRDHALTAFESVVPLLNEYIYNFPEKQTGGFLAGCLMPVALLYHVTKSEAHKKLLYDITSELSGFKHQAGGYLEWFKGKGALPPVQTGGEGSLLVDNGNPVVDNLYTVNWLPVGFIQAYLVTGDKYFYELWKDIIEYFIRMQVHSDDPQIDGIWPRSSDMELMEVYGIPNDVGWGPWSIETGWTMGQVGTGIAMGLMADRLRKFYE